MSSKCQQLLLNVVYLGKQSYCHISMQAPRLQTVKDAEFWGGMGADGVGKRQEESIVNILLHSLPK